MEWLAALTARSLRSTNSTSWKSSTEYSSCLRVTSSTVTSLFEGGGRLHTDSHTTRTQHEADATYGWALVVLRYVAERTLIGHKDTRKGL